MSMRRADSRLLAAVLLALVGCPAVLAETVTRPVQLDDLLDVRSVGWRGLRLSPDGRTIAFVQETPRQQLEIQRPGRQGSRESNEIRLLPVPKDARLAAPINGTQPAWSPDSKFLAYLATPPGEKAQQIWLREVATGAQRQLTHSPEGINPDTPIRDEFASLAWSPDGRQIAFSAVERREKTSPTLAAGEPRIYGATADPNDVVRAVLWNGNKVSDVKSAHLFVVSVADGAVRQLTQGPHHHGTPDWSPDSKQLACAVLDPPGVYYQQRLSQIAVVDASSGESRMVTEGPAARRAPRWSPNGRWLAYEVQEPDYDAPTALRFFALSSATPQAPDLPIGLFGFLTGWTWSADSRAVYFAGDDPSSASSPLQRYELGSGVLQRLSADGEVIKEVSGSKSGKIAWTASTAHVPEAIFVGLGTQSATKKWDLNPQANNWRMGKQFAVPYKSSRGHSRFGLLILPADYTPGQRYPTIVSSYTYPSHADAFQGSPVAGFGNQVMAGMGYVVFFPRPFGAQHANFYTRNPAVHQELTGPDGVKVMAEDVLAGVDEVIRLGYADPNRLGLLGFSNGGASVHYLVTLTDRFKAAVAINGVGANTFEQALRWPQWTARWTGIGKPVYEAPGEYARWSALYRSQYVHTPMLIAAGEYDLAEIYAKYYIALRYYGVDVTFLLYPGQGHELDLLSTQDFFQREMAFFDKYLRGGS